MSDKKHYDSNRLTRRRMLGISAAATAGIPLIVGDHARGDSGGNGGLLPRVSGPGHVVGVRMKGMRKGIFPDPVAARAMVDKAITTLTKLPDPSKAWRQFISADDKVAIKVNCLGTKMVSTMKEVAFAVADSLRDSGVSDANILIYDMFASNMLAGRYEQRPFTGKMRILAHRERGYDKSWTNVGPARIKFSELHRWATAVINMPAIKDHDLAGVTCTMKNMTFGVVEKPHVNHAGINEAIPHIWALEEIRGKVRLNIIDGSTILFDGGPKYKAGALAPHEHIYATTDPVAMDTIAYELIELKRAANGMRTLADVGRPPEFLKLAGLMGLGISARDKIHLETVDMPFPGPPSA